MIIACTLDQNEIIKPITEGVIVRIYREETEEFQDFRNPAMDIKEGRRGAALKLAVENGATAFAAPPETFCELSYRKAKDENVSFYNIASNLSFSEFQKQLTAKTIHLQKELPEKEVVPSN
ncbi:MULTISPECIES: hypothetical protein [Bacillus]|uniref:Uncharacterized protein n=2 Tax=Bacillus TaxID=1386 RepID=A0A0M4FRB5_9BACI|nr:MULTISPECIES: hypothetical protein [Bacillus]ALC80255.1 hypothetical protein AM592_00555 [Bacillus gobiensis]MBP1083918.1 hypothetical protein [Bacillus capparidis]MED1098396.1 hypothetical protein [Bacillus capparidis]